MASSVAAQLKSESIERDEIKSSGVAGRGYNVAFGYLRGRPHQNRALRHEPAS